MMRPSLSLSVTVQHPYPVGAGSEPAPTYSSRGEGTYGTKKYLLPPHRLESWEASRLGGKEIWKFILFWLPSIPASQHLSFGRGGLRWGGELLPLVSKVLVFALTLTLFFGCSLSKNKATRFYVLNPMDPGLCLISDDNRKGPLSIEVTSLRLPQYLERPQIVTRSSENQLELAEFHQWGGNLRKDMTRVLAKNLSQLLATPHISFSSHPPQASPDFLVELEVIKFERGPDGKVRLSAQWRLSSGKDRKSLTTQITDLESPTVEAGSDLEPTVSAMSRLLGEFSQMIGQEILKQISSRPVP